MAKRKSREPSEPQPSSGNGGDGVKAELPSESGSRADVDAELRFGGGGDHSARDGEEKRQLSTPEGSGKEQAGSGGEAGEQRKVFRNKEKVLVLSSRGIVYRYRHLMEDVIALLPHCKKDAKMDVGKGGGGLGPALNEVADLRGCSSCIYFEMRKKKDLYMWLAKTPNGPSVKFHVSAVHTMAELKLMGNHLKGSRPVLTFSPSFDRLPHLQLLKELFTQLFGTPRGHRKSKPFFDHVVSLTFLDNHVWFRNYQIVLPGAEVSEGGKLDKTMLDKMTLVEAGPRFCLNPIRIFSGSFGGATLYENPHYVSPNVTRSELKAARSTKYKVKVKAKQRRKQHELANRIEPDELMDVWKE